MSGVSNQVAMGELSAFEVSELRALADRTGGNDGALMHRLLDAYEAEFTSNDDLAREQERVVDAIGNIEDAAEELEREARNVEDLISDLKDQTLRASDLKRLQERLERAAKEARKAAKALEE